MSLDPVRRPTRALAFSLLTSCASPSNAPRAEPVAPSPEAGDAQASPSDAGPDDAPRDADASADAATPETPTLRVMTYNIKHGELAGLEAIAAVIKAEAPDLVALQEVDVDDARSGNVDQPHRLGQLVGMTSLFRTAIDLPGGGAYGVALLSRLPVLTSTRTALTSSGEQRIVAVVDVELRSGVTLAVAITHLDLQAAAREAQAREIRAQLDGRSRVILMGDTNAQPSEASMKTLAERYRDAWASAGVGDGFTIPPDTPTRRIDYVWLGPEWAPPLEAHIPDARTQSDHLPVVVTLARP